MEVFFALPNVSTAPENAHANEWRVETRSDLTDVPYTLISHISSDLGANTGPLGKKVEGSVSQIQCQIFLNL